MARMSMMEMERANQKKAANSVEVLDVVGDVDEIEVGVLPSVSSDRCYTVEDIQIILCISRPTVYNLIKQKAFKAIKIGKGYRIPKKSFDTWLEGESR